MCGGCRPCPPALVKPDGLAIAPAAGYAARAGGRTVGDMKRGAVAVLLAAVVLPVAACTGSGRPSARPGPAGQANAAHAGAARAAARTSNGCAGQPPVSPLPVWARAGFSPADQPMPHVFGAAGNIVAVLWAKRDALHSPPLRDRANKILWVSRFPLTEPGRPVIRATLAGGARSATVSVPGGPGPSIIDLPVSGCWTLHLRWPGHADELKLRYVA
jgi:hypothetical protein